MEAPAAGIAPTNDLQLHGRSRSYGPSRQLIAGWSDPFRLATMMVRSRTDDCEMTTPSAWAGSSAGLLRAWIDPIVSGRLCQYRRRLWREPG